LRIADCEQEKNLDGDTASALLIPVMKLSDAKSWSGEAYCAIFVMGLPKGIVSPQNPDNCIEAKLSINAVMNGGVIEDATVEQIDQARMTLIHAVLALRSLAAKMDDTRIEWLGIDRSK
jgi:hypothetical protein